MKKRILTMFPESENINLIKDTGMIAYSLYKYCGYDASYACYNTELSYAEKYCKGMNIVRIPKVFSGDSLNGCLFLIMNARKYDILHVFFLQNRRNIFWAIVYKILNPKGKIYVKMDADINIIDAFDYHRKGIKGWLWRRAISLYDFISTETTVTAIAIQEQWGIHVDYIPDGYEDYSDYTAIDYNNKENVILNVARQGVYQKNTEILVRAFTQVCRGNSDYKLRLIGSMQKEFKEWLEKWKEDNKIVVDRIEYLGEIESREELEKEYARSKIFCLTSRYESFGIVLVEAQARGCYVVSSNVGAARDVVGNGCYGKIYGESEDEEGLIKALEQATQSENRLQSLCKEEQMHAEEQFSWRNIAVKLNYILADGE